MLSINSYAQDYVDDCRGRLDGAVAAYEAVAASAPGPELAAFEPQFYNHLVMALDCYFGHRSRNLELKDGNALNEVRLLCTSMMHNGGRLAADKQIKLRPATSVLGLDVGDEIALSGSDFARLSNAFFEQIGEKYPPA